MHLLRSVTESVQSERDRPAVHSLTDTSGDRSRVALLCSDFFGTLAVLLLAYDVISAPVDGTRRWIVAVGCVSATLLVIALLGMVRAYDPIGRLPGSRMRTVGQLALVGCATSFLSALATTGFARRVDVLLALAVSLALPFVWTLARTIISISERRHPARALVIGTGTTARHAWELSLRHYECGFEVIGFVDDEPLALPPGAPPTLGSLADLAAVAEKHGVTRVIVAYANVSDSDLLPVLRALSGRIRVEVVPRLYELVQARGFELGRITLLEAGGLAPTLIDRSLKRSFDIVVASAVLLLSMPLLILIAATIKLETGGPTIFRQSRVGKDGRFFDILKFRTMVSGAEMSGHLLTHGMSIGTAVHELKLQSGAAHVTRVGRVLRSKSLDELPQLWNVIRGSMSLVGPRPLREYEVAGLDDWQVTTRHAVRPGITGLWQVSGRSSVSWFERVRLDCAYARNWSFSSDLRILARTIAVVIHRSDTV